MSTEGDALSTGAFEQRLREVAKQSIEDQGEVQEEAPEAQPEENERPSDDSAESDTEETPEAAEVQEDIPESYFGQDLSDLEPDRRKEILDALNARDEEIQRVLRENAELRKQQEPASEPEAEDTPPSEDDIMRAMGFDPDNAMYEVQKETALPLVQQLVQQQKTLEQVQEWQEAQSISAHWNSELDRLESDFTELPVSRDELVEFAIQEGIPEPQDAYFRYMAPRIFAVSEEAAKVRQRVAEEYRKRRQDAKGEIRPGTVPDVEPSEIRTGNLSKSIAEAVKMAAERHGSWEDALRDAGYEAEE